MFLETVLKGLGPDSLHINPGNVFQCPLFKIVESIYMCLIFNSTWIQLLIHTDIFKTKKHLI